MMKKATLWMVALVLGAALQAAAQSKQIPAINVKSLDGQEVNTDKYRSSEKFTVISFWATWCSPCKRELDAIQEVYEDWQEEYNMELVAISVDDTRTFAKVKGMVAAKGWDYDILSDIKQELQQAMSVQNVPYTFILDQSGNIVYSHSGYSPGDEYELEDKLKALNGK